MSMSVHTSLSDMKNIHCLIPHIHFPYRIVVNTAENVWCNEMGNELDTTRFFCFLSEGGSTFPKKKCLALNVLTVSYDWAFTNIDFIKHSEWMICSYVLHVIWAFCLNPLFFAHMNREGEKKAQKLFNSYTHTPIKNLHEFYVNQVIDTYKTKYSNEITPFYSKLF